MMALALTLEQNDLLEARGRGEQHFQIAPYLTDNRRYGDADTNSDKTGFESGSTVEVFGDTHKQILHEGTLPKVGSSPQIS